MIHGAGQSTLSPHSGAAGTISSLWWIMLAGAAVVFAIVVALLFVGLLRRRSMAPGDRSRLRSGTTFVVALGVALPAVVIVCLFVLTVDALPKTSPSPGNAQMRIDVVGRDWFWDVAYPSHRRPDRERDPHSGRGAGRHSGARATT